MNLPELMQEVVVRSERPDLVNLIRTKTKEAVLYAHMHRFWLADAKVQIITLDAPAQVFSLSTVSQLERFRQLYFCMPYDAAQGKALPLPTKSGSMMKSDPLDMLTYGQALKQNVYYQAGQTLNFNSSISSKQWMVGWFQFPNTTDSGFASWICEMNPYMVIKLATAAVYRETGRTEDANALFKETMQFDMEQFAANNDSIMLE